MGDVIPSNEWDLGGSGDTILPRGHFCRRPVGRLQDPRNDGRFLDFSSLIAGPVIRSSMVAAISCSGYFFFGACFCRGALVTLSIARCLSIHWAKPALISATFKNDHWRKLMEVMRKQTSLFPHYAVYICRDWNRRNGGTEKLLELEIVFF